VLGWPAAAPYDRILVSAGAMSMPQLLVDQLAEDGRIVVPVNGTMVLAIRRGDGLETSEHGSYRFVPLL
jgi:protein-L-isoaspartate(D-aspartate) O-methyltransferase